MSARRTALVSLLLLAVAAVAAASWLYLSLPSIVATQGREYLGSYGVDAIETSPPRLGYGKVYLDRLSLSGQQDGAGFDATLENVAMSYSIASLALGELNSLHIGHLTLALDLPAAQTGPPDAAVAPPTSELLPTSIEALAPIDDLSIGEFIITVRADSHPALTARGNLMIQDILQLSLAAQWQGLQIDADIHTTASPTDASIGLRATHNGQPVGRIDARYTLNQEKTWLWQADGELDARPLRAVLSTPAAQDIVPPDTSALAYLEQLDAVGRLTFSGTLAHPDTADTGLLTEYLTADLAIEGSGLGVTLADELRVNAAFNGQLARTPAGIQLWLMSSEATGTVATSKLAVSENMPDAFGLSDRIDVSWQQGNHLALALDPEAGVSIRDLAGTVRARSGQTAFELELTTAELEFDPDKPDRPTLQSAFRLGGSLRGQSLPTLAGYTSLGAGQDDKTQALSIQLAERGGPLSMSLAGSGSPLEGTGQYRAVITLDDLNGAIARYLPLLPPGSAPADLPQLTAGTLVFTTRIDADGWQAPEDWGWDSQLEVKALSLEHAAYSLDDLSLDAAWQGLTRWQTRKPAQLQIAGISAGLEVQSMFAQISLPQPTPPASPAVRLEMLELSLLGGRAFLPEPQEWDFAQARNRLALAVADLALADIVALQQNRQISAQGRLSGLLPVSVAGERITIDSGHVRAAKPGGIIRYRPDEASAALAANSRELGMAMQLLDDFHFDLLSSEVALDEAGNLLLALSLAGRNPGYEQGRAVNFNINLEQNIDPLLQSLRLGGSVVEKLEKKRR